MTERKALPGWVLDLATEGIRGPSLTRSDVAKATRQIMMSAHRAGHSWGDVHAILTDRKRHRLATQIATGRGGQPISPKAVAKFLDHHWRDTEKVVEARPAWERDDVLSFIEVVQENLHDADVSELDRSILQVIVDLANQHGTSRPAVPVRSVVERLGLDSELSRDVMKVYRALKRLADDGHWLALAKAGNRATGRANLYNLAPALAATYTGATPPKSHPAPTSHPPTSHEGAEVVPMAAIHLTDEELDLIIRRRAAADAARRASGERAPATVIPIRREAQ